MLFMPALKHESPMPCVTTMGRFEPAKVEAAAAATASASKVGAIAARGLLAISAASASGADTARSRTLANMGARSRTSARLSGVAAHTAASRTRPAAARRTLISFGVGGRG
jgi:hypothetical protein